MVEIMTTTESAVLDILIIEDNPGDVRLTREALSETGLLFSLHEAHDGESGLHFLRKEGMYRDAPTPCMVLLDLNLPRIDGREVLRQIKTDPTLGKIPVVVLTTSSDKRDVIKSYEYHANCYLRKPLDLDEFIRVMQSLKDFWFNRVIFPSA